MIRHSQIRHSHRSSKINLITVAAVSAALMAAGSFISIPIPWTPVPLTLQVFFVLLSGAAAGPVAGPLAMLCYLLIGTLGIPVFSGMRAGPAVLFGPSGGYLLAFPLASLVVGILYPLAARPLTRPFTRIQSRMCNGIRLACVVLTMIAGLAVIYAGGVVRLASITGKPAGALLGAGVVPFIPIDIMKSVAAGIVSLKVRSSHISKMSL